MSSKVRSRISCLRQPAARHGRSTPWVRRWPTRWSCAIGGASARRDAQLVAETPPSHDVLQVSVAQGVVAQQDRLALRKGKQGRPRPGVSARFSEPRAFARRIQDIESDTGYDTRRRPSDGARGGVSQTAVYDTC